MTVYPLNHGQLVVGAGGAGGTGTPIIVDNTGNSDVTAAINAALATGDGAYFLRAGTYQISDTIVIPEETTLTGEGMYLTILMATGMAGKDVIAPNADYTSATNRVHISDLGIHGDYTNGIALRYCPYSSITNIHFYGWSGTVTGDFINMGQCWNTVVSQIVYGDGANARSLLWLDAANHNILVQGIHGVAGTQYGIVSTIDEADLTESSSNMMFINIVAQRNQIGMDIRQARSGAVIGLYTEATETSLRIGDKSLASGKVTAFSVTGMRVGSTDGSTYGWNDQNYDGIIKAVWCNGVTLNNVRIDDVDGGNNCDYALVVSDAQALKCSGWASNNGDLIDWTPHVVIAEDGQYDNTVTFEGSGTDGDESYAPCTTSTTFAERNCSSKATYAPADGAETRAVHQWAQRLPRDPGHAYSLTRYVAGSASSAAQTLVARIRRDSDDATVDVYLNSGVLTLITADGGGTLAAWAAGTLYGVRWYNQSDTSVYMEQTEPTDQPVLLQAGWDSSPCWDFPAGAGQHFEAVDGTLRPYNATSFISAFADAATANDDKLIGTVSGTARHEVEGGNGGDVWNSGIGQNAGATGGYAMANQEVVIEMRTDFLENGSSLYDTRTRFNKLGDRADETQSNSTANSTAIGIGTQIGGSEDYFTFDGKVGELVTYLNTLSDANCTTVSTAMMAEYSI